MMEQSLRRVFKYLALVARGIGLFPFFIIFSYIYSKQYDEALFGAQLVGLIIAVVVGYMQVRIHAYLEEKLQEKLWLERMIIGILYSLEIGMMVYIVWNYYVTDMIMRLFTCVVYLILYSMSVKAYEQHYTRVLAIEMIVFISFCYVIAMVLGKYSVLGIMYLVVVATYIFLNNQQKLEQLLKSTHKNTPMFKRIRRDNMKWVLLVIGSILIVYPCRIYIADLLRLFCKKIVLVIGCIIHIIVMLLSLLSSDEIAAEEEAAEVGMGYMEPASTNEWLDVVFWIIVISITTYVCIKKRKEILAIIRNKWRKIKALVAKIYELLFGKKQKDIVSEDYYEDTIEEMSKATIVKLQKVQKTTKKIWIKQVKKYLKSPLEVKQYREGYKLLLQGIHMKGIEINRAHTPREIMELAKQIVGMPSLESETQQYEEIRYDEQEASLEAVIELKKVLNKLVELIKG